MKVVLTVDAIRAPLTGIGRYTVELARGLRDDPRVDALVMFGGLRIVESVDDSIVAHRVVGSLHSSLPFGQLAMRAAFAARQRVFDRAAREFRDAVLHCPNYVALRHAGPVVTTVHDLSWVHFPHFHPSARVAFLDRMLPRTLGVAARVITDSNHVRDEVVARYGVPRERVTAIPLGASSMFRPRGAEECAAPLAKFGLAPDGYLLAVATREPRKNLGRLAQAYSLLPAGTRERFPLVMVGANGWAWGDERRLVESLQASGQIRVLGFLEEPDLAALLSSCRAFALVSLYEGYGLPLLEAMASGVPTVRARGSALDEVGEDASLDVDPLDIESIAAALARAVEDEPWRASSVRRGLAIAAERTWQICVKRTVDVYEMAVATQARRSRAR